MVICTFDVHRLFTLAAGITVGGVCSNDTQCLDESVCRSNNDTGGMECFCLPEMTKPNRYGYCAKQLSTGNDESYDVKILH